MPSPDEESVAGSSSSLHSPPASFASVVMRLLADYAGECQQELASMHGASSIAKGSTASRVGMMEADADVDTEEEDGQLRARVARIKRVVALVEEAAADARAAQAVAEGRSSGSTTTAEAAEHCADGDIVSAEVRYGSRVAAAAIRSLQDCSSTVSGASPLLRGADAGNSSSRDGERPPRSSGTTLVPISRPFSLSEAALALYGANTKTVFRHHRRPPPPPTSAPTQQQQPPQQVGQREALKRSREVEEGIVGSSSAHGQAHELSFFARLSEEQRKRRFAIYTSRSALLPRLDSLDAALYALSQSRERPRGQNGEEEESEEAGTRERFYVSPAVRELSALNLAAERAMLGHTWAVRTRAMLLARLPALYDTTQKYRNALASLLYDDEEERGSGGGGKGQGRHGADLGQQGGGTIAPYFCFPHCDRGVVRVSVQQGLFMDLTYSLWERKWSLVRLHWNLWSPLAALADAEEILHLAAAEEHAHHHHHPHNGDSPLRLRCLVPNQQDAMVRHLQLRLGEEGLEAGCVAANHLLCAVVMDVVAAQARCLRDTLFAPPLPPRAFTLEVRQGTHVSLMLAPPLTSVAETRTEDTMGGRGMSLLLKFKMVAGTVVVEKTWTGGRATGGRAVHRVLAPVKGGDGGERVLLDVEGMIWDAILGSAEGEEVPAE